MIYAFEGIDCSGKTTMRQALRVALNKRGIVAGLRAEPSKNGPGAELRQLVDCGEIKNVPFETAIKLWTDDRSNTMIRVQSKIYSKAREDIVLFDRCFLSTLAYQTAQYPDKEDEIRRSQSEFMSMPIQFFYLNIDPEVALDRAIQGGKRPKGWETDMEFMKNVHEQYARLIASGKYRTTIFDATRTVEEMVTAMVTIIIGNIE